jgi:hypothetical protein
MRVAVMHGPDNDRVEDRPEPVYRQGIPRTHICRNVTDVARRLSSSPSPTWSSPPDWPTTQPDGTSPSECRSPGPSRLQQVEKIATLLRPLSITIERTRSLETTITVGIINPSSD